MSEQAAVQQLVQSPLTLVMTAESPEAFAALRQTVEDLQALPLANTASKAAVNQVIGVGGACCSARLRASDSGGTVLERSHLQQQWTIEICGEDLRRESARHGA